MPIADTSEQNAFLDNQFGPAHGTAAPSSHDLALFDGDPSLDGVEITGGGYTRVTIPNDSTWPDAVDGQKSIAVTLATPTDEWDEATHWGLYSGTALGYFDALDEPLEVSGAGAPPELQIILYFADNVGA